MSILSSIAQGFRETFEGIDTRNAYMLLAFAVAELRLITHDELLATFILWSAFMWFVIDEVERKWGRG